MKLLRTALIVPLLGISVSMPAFAHGGHFGLHGRLQDRIERQHWRIDAGVESGELTRREARRLYRQNRRIAHLERRFTRDGRLDRRERQILRDELQAASRRIARLKHNDRFRPWAHRRDRHDDLHSDVRFRHQPLPPFLDVLLRR